MSHSFLIGVPTNTNGDEIQAHMSRSFLIELGLATTTVTEPETRHRPP